MAAATSKLIFMSGNNKGGGGETIPNAFIYMDSQKQVSSQHIQHIDCPYISMEKLRHMATHMA